MEFHHGLFLAAATTLIVGLIYLKISMKTEKSKSIQGRPHLLFGIMFFAVAMLIFWAGTQELMFSQRFPEQLTTASAPAD